MSSLIPTRRLAALTPWFNRGPLASLRDEVDNLFSRFSSDWEKNGSAAALISPSLDVSETDTQIEIKMDVPGMKPEELDIEVTGELVRISGEHKEETEEKGRKFHRVERRTGAFERIIRMPCSVNDSDVNAEYHDGVLTVTLSRTEDARTHKIPVKG